MTGVAPSEEPTDRPTDLDLPLKGYPWMAAQLLWTVRRAVARQIGRRCTQDGFEFTYDGSTERVYELAGDNAFTLSEFVAEASRQANKPIQYKNLPEPDFAALLTKFGLPPQLAADLAQSSSVTGQDALFDDSRALSKLIGRPTASYNKVIAHALKALK